MLFYEELVLLDMDCEDRNDCFRQMYNRLLRTGFVRDTFLEAIQKREEEFPTGLDAETCHVAIPHTDPQHVVKPFIAVARIKKPVEWICMATDDVVIYPKFVFMLGFTQSANQINNLQVLVDNFQNRQIMDQLSLVQSEKDFLATLLSIKGLR